MKIVLFNLKKLNKNKYHKNNPNNIQKKINKGQAKIRNLVIK